MGLTLCSVHILSDEMPRIPGADFESFSNGWYTCKNLGSFEDDYKLARKISKITDKPVLFFFVYDSDIVSFSFLINGRKIVDFSTESTSSPKGISKIPEIVGDDQKGSKRKISTLLQCADNERLISLLEEYFGLNLLFNSNDRLESADCKMEKGDRLYLEYLEDYKKICGKNAAIRAEMIKEYHGKIFMSQFGSEKYCPQFYYLFGYDTPENHKLHPVLFSGNELEPCDLKESDYNDCISYREEMKLAGVSDKFDPNSERYSLHFDSNAPGIFQGREIVCPRGYYFFAFDDRNHILLTDNKRSFLILDCNGETVARCSVKGTPIAFRDGFILTEGPGSEFAYEYSPTDYVRIYRLQYQM